VVESPYEEIGMLKTTKIILFVACLVGAAVPVSVFPQTITIQTENFTNSRDLDYELIRNMGYYLGGLDFPDEWTEYTIGVSSYGYYSARMLARGQLNVTYRLQMVLTGDDSGGTQTCNFTFVGTGTT
jgi:hypothetical protein